jgi:hypothetical protein
MALGKGLHRRVMAQSTSQHWLSDARTSTKQNGFENRVEP